MSVDSLQHNDTESAGDGSIKPAVDTTELVDTQPKQAPLTPESHATMMAAFNREKLKESATLSAQAAVQGASLPTDPKARWEAQRRIQGLRNQAKGKQAIAIYGNASSEYLRDSDALFDQSNHDRDEYLKLRNGRTKPDADTLAQARSTYEHSIFELIGVEYKHQISGENTQSEVDRSITLGREKYEEMRDRERTGLIMRELVSENKRLALRSVELKQDSKVGRAVNKVSHSKLMRYAITGAVVVGSALTISRGIRDVLPESATQAAELLSASFMSAGSYLLGRERVERMMTRKDAKAEDAMKAQNENQLASDPDAATRYLDYLDGNSTTGGTKQHDLLVPGDAKRNQDVIQRAEREVLFHNPYGGAEKLDAGEFMKRHQAEMLGPDGLVERVRASDKLPAELIQTVLRDELVRQEDQAQRSRHVRRVKNSIGGLVGVATFVAANSLRFERLEAPKAESAQ